MSAPRSPRPTAPGLPDPYPWIRPILFRLEAERAHEFALACLSLLDPVLSSGPRSSSPLEAGPSLVQNLFDQRFANPLGLAAGFDKNGVATRGLALLGFGGVEVGTVTLRPQPGNPRPRLFRIPECSAILNRLGFNSLGSQRVAENLRGRTRAIPVAVNIGPNKDTGPETLVEDLLACARILAPTADYWVLNLSSPNTPGLRGYLEPIRLESTLSGLLAGLENEGVAKPLLLKVSPDATEDDLVRIAHTALDRGVAGLIATNTTVTRDTLDRRWKDQAGGLSGTPLAMASRRALRILRREVGRRLPLVSVGGISDGTEAYERIRSGASLIQVYTGLVYGGPLLPRRILGELSHHLAADGFSSVAEAIGCDARG